MVAGLVLAVHAPVLRSQGMALDDELFLTKNPLVLHPGWVSARRFFVEVFEPSTVGAYYLPLSMTSLMVDVALGGRPGHLEVFHVGNLLLHTLNTLLVLLVLWRSFGRLLPAVLAALLFGLHPLAVEPLASIGERKTLLATAFAFGSVLFHLDAVTRRSVPRRGLSIACFALALLAKPSVTPLPLLLLVFDFWPLRRLSWRAVLEKWPYFALAALFSALTMVAVARTWDLPDPPPLDPVRLILQIAWLVGFYLAKVVWPANLSAVYAPPEAFRLGVPAVAAGVAVAGWLVASIVTAARRAPAWSAGWSFFVLALLPTFGILRWSSVIAYDRYVYFPGLGVAIVAGAVLVALERGRARAGAGRVALLAVVGVALAGEAMASRAAHRPWRDSLTIWRHIVAHAPRTPDAHNGLGVVLLQQGESEAALAEFRAALAADGGYMDAHTNLGAALTDLGRVGEALPHLEYACTREPRSANAAWLLGTAYKTAGRIPEAEAQFRRALALRPAFVRPRVQLGFVQLMKRDPAGLRTLREAVASAPEDGYARLGLALGLLAVHGLDADVLATLRQAVALDPESSSAANELAWLLATAADPALRDPAEANRLADRAVASTHRRDASALDTQGAARAAAGRFAEAIDSGLEAVALAERAGNPAQAAAMRARVASYRRGAPWVEDLRAAAR